MNKRILIVFILYCCGSLLKSNAAEIKNNVDISTIIKKIERDQYLNTTQAKELAFNTLKTATSQRNIKQQIQLYRVLAELDIELANYEEAIKHYSAALSLTDETDDNYLVVEILNELSMTFQKSSNFVQALEVTNRAIELSGKQKSTLQNAVALHNKGKIFYIQGKYEQASTHFSKAKTIYQSLRAQKELAQLLDDQGNTLIVKGDYQKAIQYFFEALNIHELIDDKEGKAEINLDFGIVYSALGEFTIAEEYFKQAINKNPIGRVSALRNARVYFNLSDLFTQLAEYNKAVLFSKKSIAEASKYDEQRILTYAYLNLAEASISLGHYVEAQQAIDQCLVYTQQNNTPRLAIYTHLFNSRISLNNGEIDKAESSLIKSMELAKNINAEESLLTVVKELSELYALKDDLANAYKYLLDYDQLKDKLLNEKNKQILFQEQEKFNTIEQQKIIIKLENDKLLSNLITSKNETQRYIFISLILLLLSILLFLFLRYRHNIKSAKLINNKNEELEQAYIEIEKIALTDSLTQVKNRRAIIKSIENHYLLFKRHKNNFCIMLIDIDFFKLFNDTHGHHCGDIVLKEVAQCIKLAARECDDVARWGGEEFLVFLPETTLANAKLSAERIRLAVEQLCINYVRPNNETTQDLNVTITVGVAQTNNEDISSDSIIVRADQALYQGKENGRNCVNAL